MKHLIIILLVTPLMFLMQGCYTVVDHPDIETTDENGYSYTTKVYFYDDCNSCHTGVDKYGNYTSVPGMSKAHASEENQTNSAGSTVTSNGQPTGTEIYVAEDYYEYYGGEGGYSYYYNHPWWYDVHMPSATTSSGKSGSSSKTAGKDRNASGTARDEGSGRNEGSGRDRRSETITFPSASSSSSSSSGSTSRPSASAPAKSEKADRNDESAPKSNADSGRRSSSDAPKARDNDGSRNDNSRRR